MEAFSARAEVHQDRRGGSLLYKPEDISAWLESRPTGGNCQAEVDKHSRSINSQRRRLQWLSIDDNLIAVKRLDRDPGADVLLDLDGQVFVVDAKGQYWVRFSVVRVASSAGRPHGLNYSLTLHGPGGRRLVGFDNAHLVRESPGPGGKSRGPLDHKHRMETVRPYRFKDAATLLVDFWTEVDKFFKEKGVL